MTTSSPILFDSNILVYYQNINSPFYQQANFYHRKVISGEITGVISTQNVTEFLAVITDPKRMAKPLSLSVALAQIQNYFDPRTNFSVIYPNKKSLEVFVNLQKIAKAKSQGIFDVFLVATMLGNNVSSILTANPRDFAIFPQIKIIDLA